MKNLFKLIGIIAIIAVIGFTMIACNKSGGSSGSDSSKSSGGGGKNINSAEELKEYLDKQPVNGPDKPIKVSMIINDPMLKSVVDVIKSAGKYVSLNITGNALTIIPKKSFEKCETLVGITIPDSVTSIEEDAFKNTTWLNNHADGVVYLGKIVFSYKGSPSNITIPDSVTSIGDSAFRVCGSLTSITIPNSVTSIGNNVFLGCASLTNVTIPSSVTRIGIAAFFVCDNLASVTFQGTISSNNFGDPAFFGDLRDKYLAGGIGTYTTTAPVNENSKWTKK
jgi:hypothetical protein